VGDHAELGGQHHLVPSRLDCAPDKLFIDERPIDLGGIDEADTEVERSEGSVT
jgi:hypothetical protein